MGLEACAEKTSELTAIPVLLESLLLKVPIVIIRRLVLNLFRLDTSGRKGGIYTRRTLAASSDSYRPSILGIETV